MPVVVLRVEQEVGGHDGHADGDDDQDEEHQQEEPIDIVYLGGRRLLGMGGGVGAVWMQGEPSQGIRVHPLPQSRLCLVPTAHDGSQFGPTHPLGPPLPTL